MDGIRAQAKVRRGFAIAASKLGTPHSHYRPVAGRPALDPDAMLGMLPASFDANGYRYSLAQPFGKAVWTGLWDASRTAVGDYLVNDADTWFVASQDPLLPMQAVRCNAVLSVSIPAENDGPAPSDHGYQEGYGGDNAADESAVLQPFPCSVLKGGRGEGGAVTLPSEGRSDPGMEVLLPVLPGDGEIELGSILREENGTRYVVTGVERSAKGWRLSAIQTTSL